MLLKILIFLTHMVSAVDDGTCMIGAAKGRCCLDSNLNSCFSCIWNGPKCCRLNIPETTCDSTSIYAGSESSGSSNIGFSDCTSSNFLITPVKTP